MPNLPFFFGCDMEAAEKYLIRVIPLYGRSSVSLENRAVSMDRLSDGIASCSGTGPYQLTASNLQTNLMINRAAEFRKYLKWNPRHK